MTWHDMLHLKLLSEWFTQIYWWSILMCKRINISSKISTSLDKYCNVICRQKGIVLIGQYHTDWSPFCGNYLLYKQSRLKFKTMFPWQNSNNLGTPWIKWYCIHWSIHSFTRDLHIYWSIHSFTRNKSNILSRFVWIMGVCVLVNKKYSYSCFDGR